jgi:uncharacterized protein
MSELKIHTSLLKNEGKIEKAFEGYHCAAIEDLAKISSFNICYEASLAGEEYLLRGKISGKLAFNCGKCLKDFEFTVENIEFVQSYDLTTTDIDVEEEIRQAILLNIPQHPVCDQQCKGLCAQCGTDLNDIKCLCHKEKQTDARWDKLKKLL